MKRVAGFGLVEALLAMSLGLLVLLAGSRLFVSGLHSWQAQAVAARLQEDARAGLLRMAREVRMAGMFGCLDPRAFATWGEPLQIETMPDGTLRRLTVIGPQAGEQGGAADWTLLTDCVNSAELSSAKAPGPGHFVLPLRRQIYRYQDGQLTLSTHNGAAPLLEQVRELKVSRSSGAQGDAVHVWLVVGDPQGRVRDQVYQQTIALRNRWP